MSLYKVISWEPNEGWKLEPPFTSITEIAEKMGSANEPISIHTDLVNKMNNCITVYDAPLAVSNKKPNDQGIYSTAVPKGMYIAIVTSGVGDTIYNPIIVSADFESDGSVDASSSNIPISRSSDYEGNTAVAKKDSIQLEKTAQDANTRDANKSETVAVGDELTFTITTSIPPFATYLHPSFVIQDEMSEGLEYESGTATVTTPSGLETGKQYKVTNESKNGFTLSFTDTYLKKRATNTPVTITYKANVTTDAKNSINHENNTVTLTFSNNPNTELDTAKLIDRTNHYTFTIDGSLLGDTGYKATEVVKVGVDQAGNEITKSTTLSNTGKVGALEGAHFELYKASDTWEKQGLYTNKDKDGHDISFTDITSGSDGRITLKCLDAGKYLLVETQAPAGYIRDTNPVKIEIKATVKEVDHTEDGCTFKTNELTSYTVEINGAETANYTITNSSIATSSVSGSYKNSY